MRGLAQLPEIFNVARRRRLSTIARRSPHFGRDVLFSRQRALRATARAHSAGNDSEGPRARQYVETLERGLLQWRRSVFGGDRTRALIARLAPMADHIARHRYQSALSA